eukprot:1560658-Rhodomonas_salina.2
MTTHVVGVDMLMCELRITLLTMHSFGTDPELVTIHQSSVASPAVISLSCNILNTSFSLSATTSPCSKAASICIASPTASAHSIDCNLLCCAQLHNAVLTWGWGCVASAEARGTPQRNQTAAVDAETSQALRKLSLRPAEDLFSSETTPPPWPVSAATKTYGDGGSDFVELRQEHGFFADHTSYLRKLDRLRGCVMYRPPRFGKSLWLSVMQCYYDIRCADPVGREPREDELCFSNLFRGLAITRDETRDTSLQSAFYVLRLNFPRDYDPQRHKANFHKTVNEDIKAFLEDHSDVLLQSQSTIDEILDNTACHITLKRVIRIVNGKKLKGRLMVLVDEVDRAGVQSETHDCEVHCVKITAH